MENTEKIIIEQLKAGDEQAYKYIYDHHYVFLCHIAYGYVRDHFIAETVVGDAIFHVWEIRESLDITVSIRAYLTRAVRNRCINHLTSERERNEVSLSEITSENTSDNGFIISDQYPLGILLERELEEAISDSIHKLPKECRAVFEKSRFEEKKYEEIAQELDISVRKTWRAARRNTPSSAPSAPGRRRAAPMPSPPTSASCCRTRP